MPHRNICCTHATLTSPSPTPPPRPLPLPSIHGILTAALLAEDHPHSLPFPSPFRESKKALLSEAEGIVMSPSLGRKVRLGLGLGFKGRKKSVEVAPMEEGQECDDDAKVLSLTEMIKEEDSELEKEHTEAECASVRDCNATSMTAAVTIEKPEEAEKTVVQVSTSATAAVRATSPTYRALSPTVRTSVLTSLGYLQPLLQRTSEAYLLDSKKGVSGPAATARDRESGTALERSNLPTVPSRSFSLPILSLDGAGPDTKALRSRSDCDLRIPVAVPDRLKEIGLHHLDSTDAKEQVQSHSFTTHAKTASQPPEGIVRPESTSVPFPQTEDLVLVASTEHVQTTPRLHTMDISSQLRSMSQMSSNSHRGEDDVLSLYPLRPWSFHLRERSDAGGFGSGRSRHAARVSSLGSGSAVINFARARAGRDSASSIYSRPVSPMVFGKEEARKDVPARDVGLENSGMACVEWPLITSGAVTGGDGADDSNEEQHKPEAEHTGSLPLAIPTEPVNNSASVSFVTATDEADTPSVRFLHLPRRPTPIPNKGSSSTLASKQSRFRERFSPPKKSVRKRLSSFRLPHWGSRKKSKEVARSFSTSMLPSQTGQPRVQGDASSDDPALLTVPYELSERRQSDTKRSTSMSQLDPSASLDPGIGSSGAQLAIPLPPVLERRPTLADYERNLSVAGDDRRRPSAINLSRVKQVQEDDRRESLGVRRKLSRARTLRDDPNPLMAQALEKHQQEKAMFRSASKRRESFQEERSQEASQGQQPVFTSSSPFGRTGISLPLPAVDEHNDLLDPLEKGHLLRSGARGTDTSGLLAVPLETSATSSRTTPATSVKALSTKSSLLGPLQGPEESKKRIGTNLESWSRYPSHTRPERSGSANLADRVITRDFAVDVNHNDIQGGGGEGDDGGSPTSPSDGDIHKHHGHIKTKSTLPRGRSATFSGIVRYYSNLFTTRGWHGQNRRTSVALGGKLAFPELEMLPPPMLAEGEASGHKHSEVLKRFEERLKESADKTKEFLTKEEQKVEQFVKAEEEKLGEFVKEEESKVKLFVEQEENKVLGPGHRHESKASSTHRSGSPFRSGSIFRASAPQIGQTPGEEDTTVGPNDGSDDGSGDTEPMDANLTLDGTGSLQPQPERTATSKAELWCEMYKECLTRPASRTQQQSEQSPTVSQANRLSMLPPPLPSLKPARARTPEKPRTLDPRSTIRRFPSVTVIDDRKGHGRSISLISVKTSKSMQFERGSTQDLLEMIQAREREEREKLLRTVGSDGLQGVGIAIG